MIVMRDEIEALRQNNTWTLVPHPIGSNIVGSEWVFHTKYNLYGSIERLKAYLVAQGYS